MGKILLLITILFSYSSYASNNVIKSPIDEKQYRYLELDNRLRVLIVSDSETDKSAASLDVHIGSGSDPRDWEGLAHFLEHMLFLGTDKYPEAGEYQEFIKNNGGGNNAYTSYGHTNYYFNISNDQFLPALDRFSRFFIDPTFDGVYVDRERSVVHSEYQARKKEENRRLWDAQKQWLNPEHPYSKFSVGSLNSLRDREDKTAREKLIEFYKQHYSANIMTLVVLGKESLDQLEKWVVERFSEVPDHGIEPQLFTQPLINASLVPARLNTIPEKQRNSVSFVFPIPSNYPDYKSKPLRYISNLLGHEGEGSLYLQLKDLGWAEGLSAGPGFMDKVQGEFNVRIQLTQDGLDHIEQIGEYLFQAIQLIRDQGMEQWRFDEQSKLANISFRFAQERDPGRLVQSLSSRLQDYPVEDVLQGPYMMNGYDADRISYFLEYLNPENVNIHTSAQSLETDKVTENYDVAYSLEGIESKVVEKWRSVGTNENLKLPVENPYIPERLDLLALENEIGIPAKIESDSTITIWYQPDNTFGTPRANFYVNIMSPLASANARNLVLTELFVRLVNNQLNKHIYPAYLADLNYSLYRHGRGISIRIDGFEDKQTELLRLITSALSNPRFDQQKFSIIKAKLIRELENRSKDSPSNQVINELYRLLLMPYWTEAERLEQIATITLGDVEKFSAQLFKKVKVSVLSHGDVSLEESVVRSNLVAKFLSGSEFVNDVDNSRIQMLEPDQVYFRSLNIEHNDSALVIYFQGNEGSLEERAKMALLTQLMESPFYNDLRTTNRVGYIVHAGMIRIDETPGLILSVQSPTHSPKQVYDLYEAFLMGFEKSLAEMDVAQFEQIKSGLITNALRKEKNLSERSQRFWREIDREEFNFDSRQRFVEQVSDLTIEDLREYYKEMVLDRGGELLVQSTGIHAGDDFEAIDTAGFIKTGDATEFRNTIH